MDNKKEYSVENTYREKFVVFECASCSVRIYRDASAVAAAAITRCDRLPGIH